MKNLFKKIGLSLLVASTLYGATPVTINFQGFLKDGNGDAITGDKSIEFNLYTVATDGASIWSSTKTITVTDGVYSTVLGDTADMSGLAFDTQYYIGINVASDGEMTPRQPLTSSAYALKAKQLDVAYTLPTADGSNGQILTTNGSGSATWQNAGGLSIHYYRNTVTNNNADGDYVSVYVSCSAGSLIGGGFEQFEDDVYTGISCPADNNGCTTTNPVGWLARSWISSANVDLNVYAICAE